MHDDHESDIVSKGIAVGAGFVTDVLAVAFHHLSEPESENRKMESPSKNAGLTNETTDGENEETAEQERSPEGAATGGSETKRFSPTLPSARPPRRELHLPTVVGADVESTVGFAGSDLGVFGSIEMLKKNTKRASYVVKVVNDSADELYCARYGEYGTERTELRPSEFTVDSYAASAVIIDVPLRLWNPFDSVLVTMRNRTVNCSVNAAVPRSPILAPLIGGIVAIAVLIFGFIGLSLVKPNIEAYAVPAALLAGSPLRAAYTVTGIGTARYQITDIENQRDILASGTLASGKGYFTFNTLPKPSQYRVSLQMNGPLGTVAEDQIVQTIAASGGSNVLQLIRSFEVDDASVRSGNPIVARYIANGKGQVRLLDTSQIPVAVQTTGPHGVTAIPAPNVQKDTPYRLELVAKSGNAKQTASVGITIQPGNDFNAGNSDSISTDATTSALNPKDIAAIDAASHSAGGSSFLRIDPPLVSGGQTIHVRVLRPVSHLQITLQNAQGVPLSMRTAAAGQHVISFTVPPVGVDSKFLFVANFQFKGADQTIIQPFTVYVR